MTKIELCDKLNGMDTLKKRKLNLLLITLLVVCSLFAFVSAGVFGARADEPVKATIVNPKSNIEYYALNNPQDAFISENYSAIIQNDTSLLIYDATNGYRESQATFSALKQVKKWGDNGLILTNQAKLCTIDLSAPDTLVPIDDFANIPMNANNFDLNANYLVTVYGGKGFIFSLKGTEIKNVSETNPVNPVKQPITINQDNYIFYVSDAGNLYRCDARDPKNTAFELGKFAPDMMIADTNFVYYILNNVIYRISVDGGESEELKVLADENFDLGKLSSPNAISFYNGNLLVIDSTLNAIQEFEVTEYDDNGTTKNGLLFTGFAIAKNKTAFNRPDTTPVDVEIYGDKVALLTDTQLFVSDFSANTYARENYNRYALGSTALNGFDADKFALGSNSALLINSTVKTAMLVNLTDGSISQEQSMDCTILSDVCYQSGTYYALQLEFITSSSTYNAHVYAFREGEEFTFNKVLSFNGFCDEKSRMTVDVFGNIFLSAKDGKIYRFDFDGEGYSEKNELNVTATNVNKMTTDLIGNLFVMTSAEILRFDGNSATSITLSLAENGNSVTPVSMAMNFDNNSVYFVGNGCEVIFSADGMQNYSIKNVSVPSSFVLSDTEADISTLKIYNVKSHANVYGVTETETLFNYKGLKPHAEGEEYLYVCDAPLSADKKLAVLIGMKDGKHFVALANESDLILSSNSPVDAETQTAFIATDVNAYYLPVFSLENAFVLTDGTNTVRLKSATEIRAEKTITLFNKKYYYAKITVDSNEIYAYVPFDFTTEQLSSEEGRENFTYKKVKATGVYSDTDLSVKIKDLAEGAEIRFYGEKNGVAKIAFKDGGAWTIGYIKGENVIEEKSNALRNTLIIVAIALAVCCTSIYFILKSKKN